MFYIKNILVYTLCLPLVGAMFLLCVPNSKQTFLKTVALNFSCATFVLSLFLWVFFNKSIGTFQYVSNFFWIPAFNINFSIGIDGISIFFILLTTLLIPLCLLASWSSVNFQVKKYLICFLVMEFFLIGVFCVLDLLLFYIFFESVLIPMYLIV